jgi:hypothetical protein
LLQELTGDNQITIDFSEASLSAGQFYRGGFFLDSPTIASLLGEADFLYLGLHGFTVRFDGFVTEPVADFADGIVMNGTTLQFQITGTGSPSIPDACSTWILMLLPMTLMLMANPMRGGWSGS